MRTPTGAVVTSCALTAALLLTGCGDGDRDDDARTGAALVLLPAAARGPDPFTDSTATTTATPPPAPRTPRAADGAVRVLAALSGLRSLSGATPGLYAGTERSGSCDIGRQVGHLTRDRATARAFARVAGVSPAGLGDYVRALTPVVLRADTRVTGHGYRAGRAGAYQSVLQAGTAVLVDDRGVPRVRCAGGNPLLPPAAMRGTPVTRGTPWPGYRPGAVVVVTPAPRAVTGFTIVDVAARAWIERRTGHDVRHDRVLPPPVWATGTPEASAPASVVPGGRPDALPRASDASPGTGLIGDSAPLPADPADPARDDPPPDEPAPEDPADPAPEEPGDPAPEDPGDPGEVGPDAVPDSPDLPDGAGLIPDEPASDSIFGSPTDVFSN
ncbi:MULTISPECIES: DUF6777 domain-containing protein [unclassified Streptomyces]|uniref:DUF6777 domain-containing protein n=1 Tax=unclassified Streptomyces TaxID=2593676 RepID=UPI0033A1ED20